jgi:GNAT superfamily N-acetyltransferase
MALSIRPYRPDDAPRLAEIVQRCLREVNSRDYEASIIDRLCEYYTADRFAELSGGGRLIHVAEDGHITGTVSRQGNKVFTMFVDPDMTGRGTGRHLMEHVEELAASEGYDHMETSASITAHQFYRKLGYVDVRESESTFGLSYIVRKPLRPSGIPETPAG